MGQSDERLRRLAAPQPGRRTPLPGDRRRHRVCSGGRPDQLRLRERVRPSMRVRHTHTTRTRARTYEHNHADAHAIISDCAYTPGTSECACCVPGYTTALATLLFPPKRLPCLHVHAAFACGGSAPPMLQPVGTFALTLSDSEDTRARARLRVLCTCATLLCPVAPRAATRPGAKGATFAKTRRTCGVPGSPTRLRNWPTCCDTRRGAAITR